MSDPLKILLVEDSRSDARLLELALAETDLTYALDHVEDGEQALDHLHRRGEYASAERPDLVLLDLNLPRVDGRQVLAELKNDASLATIPVVVLSTSDDDRDVERAYQLRANSYVTKPMGFGEFRDVIRSLSDYWLGVARLPSRRSRLAIH